MQLVEQLVLHCIFVISLVLELCVIPLYLLCIYHLNNISLGHTLYVYLFYPVL